MRSSCDHGSIGVTVTLRTTWRSDPLAPASQTQDNGARQRAPAVASTKACGLSLTPYAEHLAAGARSA